MEPGVNDIHYNSEHITADERRITQYHNSITKLEMLLVLADNSHMPSGWN